MEQGIKIKIGADIVEVTKSLNDLQNDLKSLQDQLRNSTGVEFVRLNKEIERTQEIMRTLGNVGKTGFDQFGQKLESTVSTVTKLGQSANRVNFTPISQTLRDAGNFAISANTGFLAISNNVPYVIDEFVRLKQETGSAKNAFSLLAGSLAGPTGVVALIGVAATVIPILAGKFLQSEEKAKKAAKSNNDFADSLKNINQGLASEASKITGLVGVLNNDAESRERKLRAIKELKQIQPDYFSQLDLEDGKVKNLARSYSNYLGSLLSIGQAQAATKKLEKVFDELLDVNEKLSGSSSFKNNLSESDRLANRAAEKLKELGVNVSNLNIAYSKLNPEQKKWLDLYTKYTNVKTIDLTGETKQLEDRKKVLQNQVLVYSDLISSNSQYVKVTDDSRDATDKFGEKLRETLESLRQYNSEFSKYVSNGDQSINDQFKNTSNQASIFKDIFKDNMKLGDEPKIEIDTRIDTSDLIAADRAIEQSKKQTDALKQSWSQISGIIANSVSGAFTQFVADVRAGKDVFESFGNAVLDAFMNMVTGLIAVIIEAQVLAALLQAFPALNGALSALGAVSNVVGAAGSIRKNASGGIATSAQLGIVGEAGPEAIIPLSQLGYLMQQVNPGIGNMNGGGVNVNVQGALVARGTDMVAVFNRSKKSMNRVG